MFIHEPSKQTESITGQDTISARAGKFRRLGNYPHVLITFYSNIPGGDGHYRRGAGSHSLSVNYFGVPL